MASRTLPLSAVLLSVGTTVTAADAPFPQSAKINELITQQWTENELTVSPKTDDLSFLRRAFLDLVGRIPTIEEVYDFEQDRSKDKRANLIARLLRSSEYKPTYRGKPIPLDDKKDLAFDYAEEYASHMADVWSVWLLTRTTPEVYRRQMHLWLTEQFLAGASYDKLVRELITAEGKNNENGAVNYVIAHLGEMVPEGYRGREGIYDAVPITSRTTRLFLGLQTQCTQCHDHPFNPEWKQDNFWGVNAFFRQVRRDPPMMANNQDMGTVIELIDDRTLNRTTVVSFELRSGQIADTDATFLRDLGADPFAENLPEKNVPLTSKKPRREMLADYILEHDNFEKAYVNRIWGMLFGRGLNELPAYDDFGEHNPVVHEELLEYLAGEFKRYDHDTKALLEWICNSDVYQLNYRAIPGGNDTADVEPFFTRMPMKSMTPEQLYESLMTALGARYETDRSDGQIAERREAWMNKLVQNFGDDEGNEVSFNGTVIQALLMMNGTELNSELGGKGKRHPIDRAISIGFKSPGGVQGQETAMIDTLYVAALGRHVRSQGELGMILKEMKAAKLLAASNPQTAQRMIADPTTFYRPFLEDVFWALMNTNEFILNH